MVISARTRYGFRLLIYLANSNIGENIQLSQIASREKISMKYLEKIVQILKRAGFVRVTRGSKGGYRLSRDSNKINLQDIYIALEGSISVIDCIDNDSCLKNSRCTGYNIWKGLTDTISRYLSSKTLQDISKSGRDSLMYYI